MSSFQTFNFSDMNELNQKNLNDEINQNRQ